MYSTPFTIIGGIALILGNPPIPEGMDMNGFMGSFLQGWRDFGIANAGFIGLMNNLTLGLLSVYVVIAISYILAGKYKMNQLSTTACSLLCFLAIASPITNIEKANYIPTSYLDAKGLFTAMIVACVSVEIFHFFIEKNIKIRMPESVPEMVSAPFEALIALMANLLFFLLLSSLTMNISGMSFPAMIMNLMKPLIATSDSLFFVILIGLLVNGFWFLGLHGGSIVGAVMNPFLLINLTANADALANGDALPHVLASNYHVLFMNLGGAPAALPIIIASLMFARSAHVRSVTKVGLPASIFGISEPIIFGYPIVMNPAMLLGIIFVPILNGVIAYTLMSFGVIGRIVVNIPWTIPGPIGAFIATMDWKAAVLWFGLLIMDIMLFAPFVKMYDRQMCKEERLGNEEA